MSIIYDALKKVQGDIKVKDLAPVPKEITHKENKPHPGIKPYLFYLATITIGFFTAGIVYRLITTPIKTETKTSEPVKKFVPAAFPLTGNQQKLNKPVLQKTAPANIPLANTVKPLSEKKTAAFAEPQPLPVATEETAPTLVLNGIFFSGNDGYALINNRIVREGDAIGGLTVKKINSDEVELQGSNSGVKLLYNSR